MAQEVIDVLTSNIDTLWVIDCAILVFIMQAGFMCMETGLSRHKNSINVALKNAADFGVSVVIFWIFGFGLMFGTSYNGFFGTDLFFFKTDKAEYMTYFVFQAMFVATAATIISGAVAERMKFNGYLIMYSDANKGKFTGSSFPLAVLGTLILWFGWFGFNGGSNGAMDEAVPLILINTFLAAAFGLLTGLGISYLRFKKPDPFYIILGPLAGLVAITAGCNSMTSVTSIFVGVVGAIIAIIVNEVLNKFEIDDVVGAVPVHLAAGVWGTLAVGLFSDLSILDTGLDRFSQIKIQLIGIIAIGAFTFISSFTILSFFNKFYPLRVSPVQEELGLNIAEHNAVSIEHDLISILDKQSESGDLKIRGPQDPFTAGGVIGLYYNKLMSKLETSEEEKNKWRERISKEVKLAVKVQENFLPKRNLKNYPVHGINIAAREVSGDFFSFYPHNDSIYFIIADVAGKGIHAGMVMAKASTLFEVLAQSKVDPDEMVFHMNNDLNNTKTAGMFVTSIVGEYNLITDEIRWVNAGHQPAILRNGQGKYDQFESSAPPLGVIKQKDKSVYNIHKTKLNGSRFYAFTDGLSESLNDKGEEIGIDGSIGIIEQNYNKDTIKQLDSITQSVIGTSQNQKLSDDLTLISIGK